LISHEQDEITRLIIDEQLQWFICTNFTFTAGDFS
jgi:ethanolamine ammonia-lyase large subunit